ncbi:hypothetical protein TEA_010485 [Camellia sinensis var. sinensis]|uniref:Uncharacterized protein n=1 Tax=Camellia sinensis var. sinensis TaxID=542762 RepID=A0A4S4EKZ8_CAMSN|nr:hypothetical protein TEA_010485 [Camellia sinensis var. sinensis]
MEKEWLQCEVYHFHRTMTINYVTGSPPVFSSFTTEPSTAPLTRLPELAHLTTPSSPDVPFAQFLSSSIDLNKDLEKTNYITTNDLQAIYSLHPGCPTTASSLPSPVSRSPSGCLLSSFPEREFSTQWNPSISSHDTKYPPKFESSRFTKLETNPLPPLSVSRESDVYSNGGNEHHNRQNKTCKQDVKEIEAYRASFGFSADEIISTAQYVEIPDILEDSFTMTRFTADKPHIGGSILAATNEGGQKAKETRTNLRSKKKHSSELDDVYGVLCGEMPGLGNNFEGGHISRGQPRDASGQSTPGSGNCILTDEENIFSRMGTSKISRKHHLGLSSSNAEIDYRRARSLRHGKGDFPWHD